MHMSAFAYFPFARSVSTLIIRIASLLLLLYDRAIRRRRRKLQGSAGLVQETGAINFTACLREFLSQPVVEIEEEWKERVSSTDIFVERFVGWADGGAGRRAAAAILRLIRNREQGRVL